MDRTTTICITLLTIVALAGLFWMYLEAPETGVVRSNILGVMAVTFLGSIYGISRR